MATGGVNDREGTQMSRGIPYWRGALPRGVGYALGEGVEAVGSPLYIWRMLHRPQVWTDWGMRYRGLPGYIPGVRILHWDARLQAQAAAVQRGETYFMGYCAPGALPLSTPAQAAHCVAAWLHYAPTTTVYGPCVTADEAGFAWLAEYLAADGPVPMGWHFAVRGDRAVFEAAVERVQTWLRERHVLRPYVFSGVNAGEAAKFAHHAELVRYLFARALARYPFLQHVIWDCAYRADNAPSRLVGSPSLLRAGAGIAWLKWQRAVRNANTPYLARPGRPGLVDRVRAHHIRSRPSHAGAGRASH